MPLLEAVDTPVDTPVGKPARKGVLIMRNQAGLVRTQRPAGGPPASAALMAVHAASSPGADSRQGTWV